MTSTRKYWKTFNLSAPDRAWGTWNIYRWTVSSAPWRGKPKLWNLAYLLMTFDELNPKRCMRELCVRYVTNHVLEDQHLFFVPGRINQIRTIFQKTKTNTRCIKVGVEAAFEENTVHSKLTSSFESPAAPKWVSLQRSRSSEWVVQLLLRLFEASCHDLKRACWSRILAQPLLWSP